MIIVSVYVHCKTHRKRSGIEMNETLNLHRQRTKWTADIELDNKKNLKLHHKRIKISNLENRKYNFSFQLDLFRLGNQQLTVSKNAIFNTTFVTYYREKS